MPDPPRRTTEPPPPARRALARALRSVPAGGRVLCWNDAATARWLGEHRGDRVLVAGPGLEPLRAAAREPALAVVAPRGLAGLPLAEHAAAVSALAAAARRYVVIASWHPLALRPAVAGLPRLGHRRLEALFLAAGCRPLARAARAFLLRPEWVYVFARAAAARPGRPTSRSIQAASRTAAPASPTT